MIELSEAEVRREKRKDRRAKEKCGLILRSAKRIFLSSDYSDVTVELIAESADMSRASVYQYFKTKAEIYGGVLYEDMNMLVSAIEDAYREERLVVDNLREISTAYARFFQKHQEYFGKLSFFFFPGREERLPREIANEMDQRRIQGVGVIEQCVRNGMERGEVRAQDARSAAMAFWGILMGLTYAAVAGQWENEGVDRDAESVYRVGVDNYLIGLTVATSTRGKESNNGR